MMQFQVLAQQTLLWSQSNFLYSHVILGCPTMEEFTCSPNSPDSSHISAEMMTQMTLGMSVSLSGCLSVYISPAVSWRLVQGLRHLSPEGSWARLQYPWDPVREKRLKLDEWMDPLHTLLPLSGF